MKGALLVGIDNYSGSLKLNGCVNDAVELANLLETNETSDDVGARNFSVVLKKNTCFRSDLRADIIQLFRSNVNMALFYFSGHGFINERGGFIVTPDFRKYDEGISMDEILTIANYSKIPEKIIIADCCHAGAFGNPMIVGGTFSLLNEGVTIITATRPYEPSVEINGHGLFTFLLLNALRGGAADLLGDISAGSIYSHIDRSLSFWEQRPQFKTSVSRFSPIRKVKPPISLAVLRNMAKYFIAPGSSFPVDPSYESSSDAAIPGHVAVFKELQKMNRCGLVTTVKEEDMYHEALNSGACRLTQLGVHYWHLAKLNRI
jgi:hypothetical protein